MSAFIQAMQHHADMVELDIQLTLDERIVIIHDEKILRYTGINRRVRELDLEYLKGLDFGKWFSDEFNGEKILELSELFEKIGNKLKYNIEIKLGEKYYPKITERVLNLVSRYNLMDDVLISSFDMQTIKKLREIDKKVKTGIIFDKNNWGYYLKCAKKLGCNFIVPEKELLSELRVKEAHDNGFDVYPYVADNEMEFKKLIEYGVDGIITNRPDLLTAFLRDNRV